MREKPLPIRFGLKKKMSVMLKARDNYELVVSGLHICYYLQNNLFRTFFSS